MKTKMAYISLLTGLLTFTGISAWSQAIEEIKDNSNYIWGKGAGTTLNKADKKALDMLINNISVTVQSKFSDTTIQKTVDGKTTHKETVQSVIKTYSNATLNNTERIVMSNAPDAKVFRYISKEQVNQVFETRKNKIKSFVKTAQNAIDDRRIGDGLRYYYWSLILLKSHPDYESITFTGKKGNEHLLISWLPMQINKAFSNLNFSVSQVNNNKKSKKVLLDITYKGEPVVNLDYAYWTGKDWSNLMSVKDGDGIMEYFGSAVEGKDEGRIKVEYVYENKANIDNQLQRVLEKISTIPFKRCYYSISFKEGKESDNQSKSAKKEIEFNRVSDKKAYSNVMNTLVEAIKDEKYDEVERFFTDKGYEMFKELIQYGNGRILEKPNFNYFKFRGKVMCRALPITFSFNNNIKDFIEEVVFHFNGNKKIESIAFSLAQKTVNDIAEKEVWKGNDKLILINFLEHYKTAYALERLNYIKSIFSDDALIITGHVVNEATASENKYLKTKKVKYNRQTKKEYIQNLKHSFQSKEYINIQFEECSVRKGGSKDSIYGIQIKQNYYSSNYGDQGYLFLLIDLKKPEEPIIHVRTWQPEKDNKHGIYGLEDF